MKSFIIILFLYSINVYSFDSCTQIFGSPIGKSTEARFEPYKISRDNNEKEQTLAQNISHQGINGLIHMTNIQNLIGILRSGLLKPLEALKTEPAILYNGQKVYPRSNIMGVNMDTVFFGAVTSDGIKNIRGDYLQVALVFSTNVLNSKQFYYNTTWIHGNIAMGDARSLRTTYAPDELDKNSSIVNDKGEFVLAPKLGISLANHLEKIIIPKSLEGIFSALLAENKIDISGITVEVSDVLIGSEVSSRNLNKVYNIESTQRISEFQQLANLRSEVNDLSTTVVVNTLKNDADSNKREDAAQILSERKQELLKDVRTFAKFFSNLIQSRYVESHGLAIELFQEAFYRHLLTPDMIDKYMDSVLKSFIFSGSRSYGIEKWLLPYLNHEKLQYLFSKAAQSSDTGQRVRLSLTQINTRYYIAQNLQLENQLVQILEESVASGSLKKEDLFRYVARAYLSESNSNKLYILSGHPERVR